MARCAAPGLLIVVVLLMFSGSAQLVRGGCIPMGDPCGPAYWCCPCDPVTNKKLSCSLVWSGQGVALSYRCTTYAFEPTCNGLGIAEAFGLPRKLGFSANHEVKIDASDDVEMV